MLEDLLLRHSAGQNRIIADPIELRSYSASLPSQVNNPVIRESVEMVDQLYNQSYNYFLLCNRISLLEYLIKIVTAPIIFTMTLTSEMDAWLLTIVGISLSQFMYYFYINMLAHTPSVFYLISHNLQHGQVSNQQYTQPSPSIRVSAFTFNFQNRLLVQVPQENERAIKELAGIIKEELESQTEALCVLNRSQLVIYHLTYIWGYILLFTITDNERVMTYTTIVVFLGTIRYMQYYLMVAFIIVAAPFYLGKYLILLGLHRFRVYKLRKVLTGQIYKEGNFKDGCSICLDTCGQKDKVVVLRCHEQHYFHQECIRKWAVSRLDCPICRQKI